MTVENPKKTFVSAMTITALSEAITGGSAYAAGPSIAGIYRSAWYLHDFFASFGVNFEVGNRSRVPAVRELLTELNHDASRHETLQKLFEGAVDPRTYLDVQNRLPDRLSKTINYLNNRLQYDGYELQLHGQLYRLVTRRTNLPVTSALTEKAALLDYSSVTKDFERALAQASSDPEDSITAACSTVESVCKCILDEMGVAYPSKEDIQGLTREVRKHLKLSPGRDDLQPDVVQIVSGLISVSNGIGALRTHSGDAHGRGLQKDSVDGRLARLAIHAASTLCLFLIETWKSTGGKSDHSEKVSIRPFLSLCIAGSGLATSGVPEAHGSHTQKINLGKPVYREVNYFRVARDTSGAPRGP